jgi:hypothetical protein
VKSAVYTRTAILVGVLFGLQPAAGQPANSHWSMQGHDPQRTARGSSPGTDTWARKGVYDDLPERTQDNAGPIVGLGGTVAYSCTASSSAGAATYEAGSGAIFVAVGHSNGDAKLDLAAGGNDTYAALSIVLGNGDGTFQTPVRYATGTDYASVAVRDLNGDGIFSRDRGRRAT